MSSKARVLVISLDAADPGLVRELAAAGEMPTMARLLDEAAAVDTIAPEGVFVSANWPTLFTATRPDRHGYLCWKEISGATYEHRLTSPTEIRGEPIWRRLSDAGKRVAVLDVPHSIPEPLNGVMLSEWGSHDRHHGTASWPTNLAAELSARHGAHFGTADPPGSSHFAPCDYAHRAGPERTDDESIAMVEAICESIERKRRVSLHLLDRGGWDLFLNVMGEAHCVGHQFWHLHDCSHYKHDAELARRVGGDPVREVYRRLDAVVGDHLARLTAEDTAYVLFAHGMTAHHDGTHLFDHVLERLDWGLDEPHGLGSATRAAAELTRLVPRPLRGRALRAATPLVRGQGGAGAPGPLPPLHERRWFLTPNNTVVGAVRLNLAGREPRGRVHPDDARDVLRWLAQRLEELVNVDTGGPVVSRCVIADDVYRRSPGDALGDLFVEWDRSAPIERVWSPSSGTLAAPYEHWRQGDHVREGLVLACGPDIRPGRRRGVSEVADVGATFAAALGVPLPDVDGRPITSVLPGAASRPARRTPARERARRLAGRALRRSAERRVPRWAARRDLDLGRLREDHTAEEVAELRQQLGQLQRHSSLAAMFAWLPHAKVPEELLISVVTPTRDRRGLLEEAIASVQAQAYRRWELLVVDDGSIDDTPEFLSGVEDPRVRTLNTSGGGVCAARNAALDVAHGDVIAYLDDDNQFDPQWLKAVALTFLTLPDAQVCYGARIFDDEGRFSRGPGNARPGVQFLGWDPGAMRERNLVDMNVLAHRPSHMRFDEQLNFLSDWDLVLRLARDTQPVEVPAIAAYYRTDASGRLSSLPPEEVDRERDRLQSKLAADDSR